MVFIYSTSFTWIRILDTKEGTNKHNVKLDDESCKMNESEYNRGVKVTLIGIPDDLELTKMAYEHSIWAEETQIEVVGKGEDLIYAWKVVSI